MSNSITNNSQEPFFGEEQIEEGLKEFNWLSKKHENNPKNTQELIKLFFYSGEESDFDMKLDVFKANVFGLLDKF